MFIATLAGSGTQEMSFGCDVEGDGAATPGQGSARRDRAGDVRWGQQLGKPFANVTVCAAVAAGLDFALPFGGPPARLWNAVNGMAFQFLKYWILDPLDR